VTTTKEALTTKWRAKVDQEPTRESARGLPYLERLWLLPLLMLAARRIVESPECDDEAIIPDVQQQGGPSGAAYDAVALARALLETVPAFRSLVEYDCVTDYYGFGEIKPPLPSP